MNNNKLISAAEHVLRPHTDEHGRLHGDVGAAVLAENGKIYTGVCVDTPGWGLCAERSALAAMITDGVYTFKTIVAVWRDPSTEKLHVLPPCGICRDFMKNIHSSNLHAQILLDRKSSESLAKLLPRHEWPDPIPE